jgi:UDP-N-acetylmuramate dehydrogenase
MAWYSDLGSIVRRDEPLAPHTWLQIGGPAEFFAEPTNRDQLSRIIQRCRAESIPARLLGGGSNLLVREQPVPGVVVRLSADDFCHITVRNSTVQAGGGAKLGHVISTAVGHGLGGLETLVGIPGSIGGALHGNAGTRGGDIGQWTHRATVMTRTGEILQRERGDLVFAYRHSCLDELVILDAEFHLEESDPQELTKRMQKQWIVRKANQPHSEQRAACVFRNPRGMSAGTLIEQSGLKGTRVGKAEISERHGNFIVTEPGATSEDVLRLVDLARERVAERMGVELETELEIW